MTGLKLGARLECAASLALDKEKLALGAADIGTDHALLPIELVLRGCPRALVSDINEGPIEKARMNIAKFALQDKITAVRRDGLDGIETFAPGVIFICGMGGELIADIISNSEYPARSGCDLILQPMTMQAQLRRYLSAAGYDIREERVVLDDGKYYQLILASYTGAAYEMTQVELILGRMNIRRIEAGLSDIDRGWLARVRDAAAKRINGRLGAQVIDTEGQESDLALVREIDRLTAQNG